MADDEKCPGCREAFAPDAITGMLADPWYPSSSDRKRRWHLRCHQDEYMRDMNRDRRTEDQRRAVGDWSE